jgi:NAD+ kinase
MFKKIVLIANSGGTKITETLRIVADYLLSRGLTVTLDRSCAALMPDPGLRTVTDAELPTACDLAIAIGGDGTMLKAARLLADHRIPLLGINRGRLGFLADIPAESVVEHLERILAGNFVADERFQLHCQVDRGNKTVINSDAFNDVIIQRWNIAKLIQLTTYVNGKLVNTQRSDGLIIASPTGSTAYALSGGGPILHPDLDALVLVPICPHTLSNRPIVIAGDDTIEVVIDTSEIDNARLTCDGEIKGALDPGDRVIVRKKANKIRLIHPADHDHYQILRAKLNWG